MGKGKIIIIVIVVAFVAIYAWLGFTANSLKIKVLETRLNYAEETIDVEVVISNPSSLTVKIAHMRYEMYVDGNKIGSGETYGITVHPGEVRVTLKVKPEKETIRATLESLPPEILEKKEITYKLKGPCKVNVIFDYSVFYETEGTLSLTT